MTSERRCLVSCAGLLNAPDRMLRKASDSEAADSIPLDRSRGTGGRPGLGVPMDASVSCSGTLGRMGIARFSRLWSNVDAAGALGMTSPASDIDAVQPIPGGCDNLGSERCGLSRRIGFSVLACRIARKRCFARYSSTRRYTRLT